MHRSTAFGNFADGGVDQMVRRVGHVDNDVILARALSCDVGVEVWLVAEGAFVCKYMSVSLDQLTVVELAVYKLEDGGPFLGMRSESLVHSLTRSFSAGTIGLRRHNQTPI